MTKRKKIIVSVITDLVTDQRVIRICTSLQRMGFDVHVFCRRMKDSLPPGQYSFRVTRFRCYFNHGIFQYAEFMTHLFFRLLFRRTDYFLANDLDSLLPNYLISKIRNKHLFYDTHEYFTGVPELRDSPVKYRIWRTMESMLLPRLKTIYTVNNSVRDQYQKDYGVSMQVIRNVPSAMNIGPAPMPGNWQGKIILMAQGTGLNKGRSCIEVIDALPLMDERFHLVFIGGGTAWQDLKNRRQELRLESRIDMLEKMPPSELKSLTLLASLGISLDSFDVLNYLFNLPNKVFDYLQAGIPLFATAIPEVKNIVDHYHCGIVVTDVSPRFIAETITALFNDQERYQQLRSNAITASKELNWENEEAKLEAIYRPYL